MRVPLTTLFDVSNGTLTVKHQFRLGGISCHLGVTFRDGQSIGGIVPTEWFGHDFDVDFSKDEWVIRGIYGKSKEGET